MYIRLILSESGKKGKFFSRILLTVILLILALPVNSQEKQGIIKGRVFNASTNEGVPFATVVITGTTTGAYR